MVEEVEIMEASLELINNHEWNVDLKVNKAELKVLKEYPRG